MRTLAEKIQEATAMAEEWKFRGNNASDRGEHELAERHYARAQKWMDRMNDLLGNGEEGAALRARAR